MLTIVAKGLPGSKSDPSRMILGDPVSKYVYCTLHMAQIKDHSLDTVKGILDEAHGEYDGIDCFTSERYGAWDVSGWCEDRGIAFEPIFPNYDRQREAFNQMLLLCREGRIKMPPTVVIGSKTEDIFDEELSVFMHVSDKRWFGSPEKMEKTGIQDDSVYSFGWTIYGGRNLTADSFRIRKAMLNFGFWSPARDLVGNYR